MLKRIFAAIFVIIALISCRSNGGFQYSQNFVEKERALIPAIDSTEDKVEAFVNAGQFDSMRMVSKKMEERIGKVVDEIKAQPAPDAKEGERFKSEVVRYFEFMKHVYTVYVEFADVPVEERAAVVTKLQDIIAQKQQVIDRIKQSQREFAKANGFRMEKE